MSEREKVILTDEDKRYGLDEEIFKEIKRDVFHRKHDAVWSKVLVKRMTDEKFFVYEEYSSYNEGTVIDSDELIEVFPIQKMVTHYE